jgi:hypothetical protein
MQKTRLQDPTARLKDREQNFAGSAAGILADRLKFAKAVEDVDRSRRPAAPISGSAAASSISMSEHLAA